MKHITLAALLLLAGAANAQVFESDLETWTDGLPDGFVGARNNISTDSIFQETTNPHSGTSAVRLQLATGTHKRFTTDALSVTAGATYDITFWVRGTGSVRTNIYDGRPDASGYGTYNPYVALDNSAWQEVTQSVTAAMTTAEAEFVFSVLETAGPAHIVIDDVTISEGVIVPPTEATIYEIQFTSAPDGASPLANDIVITSGIVTGAKAGTGYFIQDGTGAWNGIYVNDATNSPVVGDAVELTASVQENFGFTRLNNVTAYAVASSGNALPAAEVLTPAGASQEQWESVLVTVPDVECTTIPNQFQEWTITNWQGSMLVDDFLFATTPTLGSFYTVTGPVQYSFEAWRVLPRSLDDLGVGSSIGETSALRFSTYPNPADVVVNLTINGTIGSADYTVFDATGRLAVTGLVTAERTSIDVSGLTNGIYVMTIRNNGTSTSSRIAVQH